jgi:cation diffusion facilitator family transporter
LNLPVSHQRGDTRALRLALGIYVLLFVIKLGAYFLTGVLALLAESLHTLSDIAISAFLLAAAAWSQKAADDDHMFGHGRAQNVAALIAATLFISITSIQLYQEAIPHLLEPEQTSHENLPLALAVVILSMLIATVPLVGLLRQSSRGAAAKAQLLELFNDEAGLLAVLVGTLFLLRGEPLADPIATIAVATLIAVNAFGLLRENVSFLLGRSPGPEFLKRVTRVAMGVPGVLDVHDLRAEYIGPEIVRASMHIMVPRGMLVEDADRIAEDVQRRVHDIAGCDYCIVHLDAAAPEAAQRKMAAGE